MKIRIRIDSKYIQRHAEVAIGSNDALDLEYSQGDNALLAMEEGGDAESLITCGQYEGFRDMVENGLSISIGDDGHLHTPERKLLYKMLREVRLLDSPYNPSTSNEDALPDLINSWELAIKKLGVSLW